MNLLTHLMSFKWQHRKLSKMTFWGLNKKLWLEIVFRILFMVISMGYYFLKPIHNTDPFLPAPPGRVQL